jgi:hypothetical protein
MRLERIESAILRTILYADVFDFPLTAEEIHHFLIHDEPTSLGEVKRLLANSRWLDHKLESNGVYFAYKGRRELFSTRESHEEASQRLWPLAVAYGMWLARLPFVRMVAITGALAMRNASDEDDDLDYLLVTTDGRVWLARAFAILLVRLGRLWGVEICPNYVLAESALEQQKRDLFMAHEVAQMTPLYGHHLCTRMRRANSWVSDHLPNAATTYYAEAERPIGRGWIWFKRGLEMLLGGRLGDALERWEYRRKLRRFARELRTPYSSAQLDERQVKGHFNDHGHPVLQKYSAMLSHDGLEEAPLTTPGD